MIQADVLFALRAAALASRIVRECFSTSGCAAEAKSDGTPVSETDLRIEDELRAMVRRERPADAFLGEERGESAGEGSAPAPHLRRWVVDPIDGTKSLVRGVPLFGSLIGLQVDGVNALGVASFPAIGSGGSMGQTYIGGAGVADGCLLLRGELPPNLDSASLSKLMQRAERCRVSKRVVLAGATVCVTDPRAMLVNNRGWLEHLSLALGPTGVLRSWGDCYGHAMVASGRADVMIDSPMKIWDVAAIEPLIRSAGGVIADWNGDAPGDGSRGVISAASGELLARVIESGHEEKQRNSNEEKQQSSNAAKQKLGGG